MCTNCYSFSQRLPENDRAVLCWRMNRFTCSVFLLPSLHFSSRVSALQWAERMASCSSLIADWWSVCVHVPPAIVPCSLLSLCECLSVCVCALTFQHGWMLGLWRRLDYNYRPAKHLTFRSIPDFGSLFMQYSSVQEFIIHNCFIFTHNPSVWEEHIK